MDVDALRIAAGLEPLSEIIKDDTPPPKKERGHGRGTTVLHERPGQHPELRGVPLIGTGPGVIAGTRPGDTVSELDLILEDVRIANAALAAAKAAKLRQVRDELRKGRA